ncbi:YqhG family protein [Lentibacillus saliphilus]|uniref:YqhG family protein n=1 Tax=Lentibacillus saliphilus TaxID=2737028 RepID=UPI001C30CDBE|nr:YqhG family protein [Lentibacillus saliphilus]
MGVNHLHHFLEMYFKGHQCDIINSKSGLLTVQLTEEMDKALMNRPFYWHYIKKIGQEGDPATLTFNTDPSKQPADKAEHIHYGSPRLQQIFDHLKGHERYTKLFQKLNTTAKTPLYPWLVVNIKITYTGKQRKEEMLSIGLNMINGMMKSGMMEELSKYTLQSAIPDFCYTISPMIKLSSGFGRIESVISDYIQQQDHSWAQAALEKQQEELELLKHFYDGLQDDEEPMQQFNKEQDEIKRRLTPSIQIDVVNGGLFYLDNSIITPKQ